MPLYTYRCEDCMLEFDRFQPAAKRRHHPCPECDRIVLKVISTIGTAVDSTLRDKAGQPVWFPKDGRPYFDRALRREFRSKKEKIAFMNEHNLVMDGSEQNSWPIESGDLRNKSYRREHRLED